MENHQDISEQNRVSKIGFEAFILVFLIGYIILIEVSIFQYPGSYIPIVTGIVIAVVYTILILNSPKKIRFAKWWAVLSIVAILYWGYLLIDILKNRP